MAYTDDAVKAKLSSLNDTQDSIVTVAQWIMFHRRYAARTAQLWTQRLKESGAAKRLNFIYLANEVVQQSKARKKDNFLLAFSPIIAEAVETSYKNAPLEIQHRLRRVVEVWRQRSIFDQTVQDDVEARIEDSEKDRSASGKRPLGGSLFSSSGSAPIEIQPLIPLQNALSKAELSIKQAVTTANAEYDAVTNPNQPTPSPPVLAAKLSTVLKSLANAEGAVSESIKAREALVEALEKILKTNRDTLTAEQTQKEGISTRRAEIDTKKRDVEDGIMQGLSAEEAENGNGNYPAQDTLDAGRPDIEALTPPPVESFTPPEEPPAELLASVTSAQAVDPIQEADNFLDSFSMPQETHIATPVSAPRPLVHPRPFSNGNSPTNGSGLPGLGTVKRRKLSHGLEDEGLAALGSGEDAMDGLDDEVKGMLES